jgi:hypothetical protein
MSTTTRIPAAAATAPLDEVMLAMDVVDTLRHHDELVARELQGDAREADLVEKLRKIYRDQGLDVSDAVLKEGVKALAESRFTYTAPKPSLQISLAHIYVSRQRWAPAALGLLLVAIVGFGGYFLAWQPLQAARAEAARIELSETLPRQMDSLYETIYQETKVQSAATSAEELVGRGKIAAAEGNRVGAEKTIAELTALRDKLRQDYTVTIVNRDGQRSGFWTFPKINTEATNYYLIVEALDGDGKPLSLPVTNEETGLTETVSVWGQRVPENVYRSVEADKRDDGIIERRVVGTKEYGFLDVDWTMPVMTGAVTKW